METVKGFKDVLGEEALKREKIKEILIKKFKAYGFQPAETPIIEQESFVKGNNSQDEAISDIFRLKDKGGRSLALRYEFTFQLKRIAANKRLPFKRYQIGSVFRDEPVSSNRFREFTQCDIDIGGAEIKDEAEIVALTSELIKKLGINFEININNRKLMNEILDEQKIKNKIEVIREIDKLDKLSEKEVKENLKKFGAEKVLEIFKKPESYFNKYKSYEEIKELKKYCNFYGVKVNFQPNLARGLSYYNRTVYEVKVKGEKDTIAGGGSYIFNNVQFTGISFGLERLSSLAKIDFEGIKVLLISINQEEETIKMAQILRGEGISCLVLGKVGKGLDYANMEKIPYVVFVGEKEIKEKKFKLRDMGTGEEKMLKEKELIEKLKNRNKGKI